MGFDRNQDSYKSFRDIVVERTSAVVAWVGSGASASIGIPTWPGLRERLIAAGNSAAGTLETEDAKRQRLRFSQIAIEPNPWVAFERLRTELGPATYRDLIRRILAPAETASIPPIYSSLWKIGVSGILSLNLDRLAAKAYVDVHSRRRLVEFTGNRAGEYTHILKSPNSNFIANLHGVVDEVGSWVFCNEDLRRLHSAGSFRVFLQTVLCSRTILFVGISADDVAVGGFCERLRDLDIDVGTHYWLTSRLDVDTNDWAERSGIRLIRYREVNGDHSAVDEFFADLQEYVSVDDTPLPITPNEAIPVAKPPASPDELMKLEPDEIRRALDGAAANFLKASPPDYEGYSEFCAKYDGAIYRAWYVIPRPPHNRIYEWTIEERVAKGAFGSVYRATGDDGNQVALKVLLEEIRNQQDLLHAFRRGVRSMRILEQHNTPGMARYIEAREIPAFVVMEWIDGPNLRVAVESSTYESWDEILGLARELATTLHRAHKLPERVLHRDIRPSNIMIRNLYNPNETSEAVFTDFDLSWHKDASEQSVIHGSTMAGYLAPEQIAPKKGVSTRHSAVDSFGLGMTLYFVISRKDPLPAQHRHVDWINDVYMAASKYRLPEWQSTGNRFARLLVCATREEQSERWDIGQIASEVDRLIEANSRPGSVRSAELIAEEIACRYGTESYTWDADRLEARISLASGIDVVLTGDETSKAVKLSIGWASAGDVHRKKIGKYIPKAIERAHARLRGSGWINVYSDVEGGGFEIRAAAEVDRAARTMVELGGSIADCCKGFVFD